MLFSELLQYPGRAPLSPSSLRRASASGVSLERNDSSSGAGRAGNSVTLPHNSRFSPWAAQCPALQRARDA